MPRSRVIVVDDDEGWIIREELTLDPESPGGVLPSVAAVVAAARELQGRALIYTDIAHVIDPPEDVELLSLRDSVEPFVREALRSHAESCSLACREAGAVAQAATLGGQWAVRVLHRRWQVMRAAMCANERGNYRANTSAIASVAICISPSKKWTPIVWRPFVIDAPAKLISNMQSPHSGGSVFVNKSL